ncbi:MAG: hypothetical protein R3F35_12915 [Myxococcota bacterium]
MTAAPNGDRSQSIDMTRIGPAARRGHVSALLVGLLILAAAAARAADGDAPVERPRLGWEPRAEIGVGLHHQSVKVVGSNTLGGTAKASRPILTSVFAFNGGLASPELADGLVRPRIYLRGGYKTPVAEDQRLVDDNTVITPSDYQGDPTLCGTNVAPGTAGCEHNVRLDIQLRNLWSVGTGVELELPFEFQTFRAELGLEYVGEELQYTGTSVRVDRGVLPGGGAGQILATVSLPQTTRTDFVHTLGPRAALSVEVAEVGPVSVQFGVETTVAFYLGDYDLRFGRTDGAESQSYGVQGKDPFLIQAGGVLRFGWR